MIILQDKKGFQKYIEGYPHNHGMVISIPAIAETSIVDYPPKTACEKLDFLYRGQVAQELWLYVEGTPK